MKPVKKILVPVDFSAHSTEAVRFAADLARRFEASLTLVHVYQPMTYVLPEGYVLLGPAQLEELLGQFKAKLADAKRDALALGAPRVESVLLEGGVISELMRYAAEGGCDMIVMGTHGRTGWKHMLIGSVAENVVRTAPCPVLTVRAQG